MMKHLSNQILLTLFMFVVGTETFAAYSDFSAKNEDGITIHYRFNDIYYQSSSSVSVVYADRVSSLVIPEEVTYLNKKFKVTWIDNQAFYGFDLTSIILPKSLNGIGELAFSSCKSLTSIVIPEGVTYIQDKAFKGCDNLISVTLPRSLQFIEGAAFEDCTSLNSINLSDSLSIIGPYAFHNCTSLTSITIPPNLRELQNAAFGDCTSLSFVTISDGVQAIFPGAFAGCSSLSNIVLPNSCILFQSVFNTDLTTIVSYIDRPYIIYGADSNKRTFTKNTYLKAKLYVPKGTIEKYKSTDGWKDFVNIIEGAGESSTIMNLNTNKMHIESEGNSIRISGLNSNTTIIVYNTAGHIIGSAKTQGEDIEIVTMLKKGEYGILKIGDRVVKVLMK